MQPYTSQLVTDVARKFGPFLSGEVLNKFEAMMQEGETFSPELEAETNMTQESLKNLFSCPLGLQTMPNNMPRLAPHS